MESQIGRDLRRLEDGPLLTGGGLYASDPKPSGLVHIAIRRAGVPRAEGLSVDLTPALAMPGVLGAWKAGELGLAEEHMPEPAVHPPALRRPVLAADEVRMEGEAVAVVAAETEYQAADAAEAVAVDLKPLPLDRETVGRQEFRIGDVDAAASLEGALTTVHERFEMARICGAAIEPRAVLADWRETEGTLYVRATVGWVHGLRDTMASCLGLDPGQVVALTDDVGGSFGAKNNPYPEYVIAGAVSRLLGRPVRWTASRTEDGHTTGQAHSAGIEVDLSADGDGRLCGARARIEWSIGAYQGRAGMQDRGFATHMASAYRMPVIVVEVEQRYSDTPPAAFIRGGGRPVGNFAIERTLDRLARRLGLDPIELRRRNLVPASAMPYETGFPGMVYDGGDYERLLDLVVERMDVDSVRRRQRGGEPLGLGVVMCVESTGIGMSEPSRVAVLPDGTAHVFVGSTPQGQGHRTLVAQVTADRLGWPLDRIVVHAGDSRNVPFSAVTAGSRTALEVGNSVALSAAAARRKLLERASEALEAAPADLVLEPGGAGVRGGPQRRLSLSEVVGEGLEAEGTWDSKGRAAWASSCHAALVRLDLETGGVEMVRYVLAHDSGRPINPRLVEGQLQGGYAHGLGYALFEEALYSEDGAFLTPSFLDYTIPSAPELRCEPELIHVEGASSQNPEGFRGVGEAGTIAVPAAVANAVEDGLHAAGRPAQVDAVPVTPRRLWEIARSTGGTALG